MVLHAVRMIIAGIKLRCLAPWLLISLAMGSTAHSSASLASHGPIAVHVVEKGVYEAETIASTSKREATGIQHIVRNPRLVRSTATVPGRVGVRFGVRYVIGGSRESNVDLKLVIRFPEAGLLDPKTGARYFESEHSLVMPTGASRYWEYHLENDWEIVPGVWQFEFWSHAGRLAVERFCVINATRQPEAESVQQCSQFLIGSRFKGFGNEGVRP